MAQIKLQAEGLNLADTFAFSGTVTGAGGGKIGQVIFGNTAVKVVGSGGGFVDTGLTASITPTATSSKVLVLINQQFYKGNSTSGYVYMKLQRQIDGGGYSDHKYITALGNYVAGDSGGTDYIGANTYSGMMLDTTNTTSQVDYKTVSQNETWNEMNPDDTGGAERGEADITLMEILA
jgi:hypothetical protein